MLTFGRVGDGRGGGAGSDVDGEGTGPAGGTEGEVIPGVVTPGEGARVVDVEPGPAGVLPPPGAGAVCGDDP